MAGLTYTVIDTTSLSTTEIYGKTLTELAKKHDNLVALTADLGKSTKIGIMQKEFPERFFNLGIAEQNLFGVAAGMAGAGLVPFISTFAVFASMRALEQVRTDLCYPNLNAKIIATHSGLSFGQAGTTHHCTEDIGIMRSLANMTVIVPADGIETSKAVQAAFYQKGPMYLRINRGFDQKLYEDSEYEFEIGKAIELQEGTDLTIIACGSCVYHAVEASKILKADDGLSIRVINMHTIKPMDKEAVMKAVQETRRIITVEDHNLVSGLGSAVAEVIAEGGKACAFKRLGIPDTYCVIGLHEDLMNHYGIDTEGIAAAVREIMGKDFEEDDNWEDEV